MIWIENELIMAVVRKAREAGAEEVMNSLPALRSHHCGVCYFLSCYVNSLFEALFVTNTISNVTAPNASDHCIIRNLSLFSKERLVLNQSFAKYL